MDRVKNKKTETKEVEEFLTTTGFILEMEVAELLMKQGYDVEVNKYFHDYDEDKQREIDIIASKIVNEIKINLIIECKQSLIDDWIFICSDREPKLYYNYIKHSPEILEIKEKKIFDNMYVLDSNIPISQNYIIKDRTKKKSTSIQIETCLEKVPKALVDFAHSKEGSKERSFFIPVSVFSGQIFTAQYNKKLSVKSVEWVRHESRLDSDGYTYTYNDPYLRTAMILHSDVGAEKEIKVNSRVATTSRRLTSKYLIDFVTKAGLKKLISRVETDVKELNLELWETSKEKTGK